MTQNISGTRSHGPASDDLYRDAQAEQVGREWRDRHGHAMGYHEETVIHQQEDADDERFYLLCDKDRLEGLVQLAARLEAVASRPARMAKVRAFLNSMTAEISERLKCEPAKT